MRTITELINHEAEQLALTLHVCGAEHYEAHARATLRAFYNQLLHMQVKARHAMFDNDHKLRHDITEADRMKREDWFGNQGLGRSGKSVAQICREERERVMQATTPTPHDLEMERLANEAKDKRKEGQS